MADTRQLGAVYVVTDSETSQDQIGDIDGGFSETDLLYYIREHGHQRLSEKLTIMQWQIWDAVRQIDAERTKNIPLCVGPGG